MEDFHQDLQKWLPPGTAEVIDTDIVQRLWQHRYRSLAILSLATRDGLKEALADCPDGVPTAVVDAILKAQAQGSEKSVLQQGSLLEGELFVTVLMRHGEKEVKAELLLDTGTNMDINISDYKADQLGLPRPSKRAARSEMGQQMQGAVTRRGAIETALLLEGDGDEVLEDPLRSAFLEVWTDVGSSAPAPVPQAAAPDCSSPAASTGEGSAPLAIKVLSPVSPIQKGKDRLDFDAILGAPGMAKLRLGINKTSGRVYVKRRDYLRRV